MGRGCLDRRLQKFKLIFSILKIKAQFELSWSIRELNDEILANLEKKDSWEFLDDFKTKESKKYRKIENLLKENLNYYKKQLEVSSELVQTVIQIIKNKYQESKCIDNILMDNEDTENEILALLRKH